MVTQITAVDAVTNSTGSYSQQLIPFCTSPDLAFDFSWKMELNNTNFAEILGWYGPWFVGNWYPGPEITFPVGTTTWDCTATDYAGNVGTGSFTITVVLDSTSLTITVPPDFTAYATNSTGQSYHQYYPDMINNPLYSGINSSVNLCDGTSQSWGALLPLLSSPPVCDSNGNIIQSWKYSF